MIQKSRMLRQLDSIDDEPKRKTYGRSPPIQSMRKSNDLPTNMVFWMEETQDVFPLNQNGASQFLKKMNVPPVQENVDWVIDSLLNTPIQESIDLNGYSIAISCECNHDPGNHSLSELGIAKSMILKPINRPPTMIEKNFVTENNTDGQVIAYIQPNTYGVAEGGRLVSGDGVLLGKTVFDAMRVMKRRNVHDDTQVQAHNNAINKAKRMMQ